MVPLLTRLQKAVRFWRNSNIEAYPLLSLALSMPDDNALCLRGDNLGLGASLYSNLTLATYIPLKMAYAIIG